MSERESWMPSDEEMDQARVECALMREAYGSRCDDNEPLRHLLRAAVSSALAAKEREKERAVLEARIEELHDWGCCVCQPPPYDGCPTCSREHEYRAQLAALDAREKGEAHE